MPAPAHLRFPQCPSCPALPVGPPGRCLDCAAPAVVAARGLAWCATCGQARQGGRPCANPWCARADRWWSVVWSVTAHDGPMRRVLVDYKYRGERGWAPLLGRLVAGWLVRHATEVEEFDLLVPVPSYCGPGARRGWDPVGSIAAHASAVLGPRWAVDLAAVAKVAETPPLARAGATTRLAAAEGPLRRSLVVPDPSAVAGRRVLVLDDVLTAGTTLREVARVLHHAGVEEVAGLVLTRPPRRRVTP